MVKILRPVHSFIAAAILALCGCGPSLDTAVSQVHAGADGAATAHASSAYGLDALYSLPRLDGTPPDQFVWSQDSTRLAFVWNDSGLAFRDLWICATDDCEPVRITHYGDTVAEDSLHAGIAEAVWNHPAQNGLFYVLDGNLHAVALDGQSLNVEPARESVRQIQLSPGGERLAFVDGGPTDPRQFEFGPGGGLWVRSATPDAPAAREIVSTEHDLQYVESYEWSGDGRFIALVMADKRGVAERKIHYDLGGEAHFRTVRRAFPGEETTRRRIGVVDVESGQTRWMDRPDELRPIWSYGLSGDASRLFVNESDFLVKEHVVDLYDTSEGSRQSFYQHTDPANVIPGWKVAWAPGDDGLIILTDRDGFYHLYHQREADGPLRTITKGTWEIESFSIDGASAMAYFVANEVHPAERHIYRVPLAGGAVERLSQRSGTHKPVYAPDFHTAAVRFSNDTTPPDLYLNLLVEGQEAQRITHSPLDRFDGYEWAEVRYPRFGSHIDSTPLIGRLLLPTDFDPTRQYPMIVSAVYPNTVRNYWGGGSGVPIWGLDQHLIARGYVILAVDVRGSWGHGRAFSQRLLGDYGGIDTDDIESGVRHLIDQGFVDSKRIGIWGWSYGGLMTLMSLAKKPGLYAVGVADAPATNVWHAFPEQMWVMGERKGDDYPARYERMSALYQADNIQDPLMILHGTADAVVMYSDSIAFMEKLIAREFPFEFVPMPGATHVWADGNLARQRYGYKKIVNFFDRHLQH